MKKSSSSSSFSLSSSFSFSLSLTLFLLLSLPLHAAEVTAELNFTGFVWGRITYPVCTSNTRLQWHYSGPADGTVTREAHDSNPLLEVSRNTTSPHPSYLATSFDGQVDKVIPNVRLFTFRAKKVASEDASIEVQYRESAGSWITTGLMSEPSLSGLSTDWQMFTITLPEGHDSVSLCLRIITGSNTILLDDFIVTYDPDPSPSPAPDPCTNCFQISF